MAEPDPSAPTITSVSLSSYSVNVGSALYVSAEVTGYPIPTASFRWLQDGVVVPGATASSFRPTDPGVVRCELTVTNGFGSAVLTSAPAQVWPVVTTDPGEGGDPPPSSLSAAGAVRLGETVNVTHPRFGLSAGENMVVVSIDEDLEASEVTYLVWR